MHNQKKTLVLIINTSITLFFYFFALNLMALGINLYIKAGIGIGSWDVLHNNLTEFYGLTFGTWVAIVGVVTILVSQLFYRSYNAFLAIVTGLIMGRFIDIWLYNVFTFDLTNIYLQIVLFFVGIILLGSGISLLVLTKLPPTPPDVLMVSFMKRFKLNFTLSKTLTEASVFFVAVIVGYINKHPFNNLGIGTILTTFIIGFIVQYSSKIWKKLFDKIDILKKIIYNLIGN